MGASINYRILNQPVITMVHGSFLINCKVPFGFVEIWRPDHMDAKYYARWWLAPFLGALLNFSAYWDIQSYRMRLDAPEFLRAHEGEAMSMPFHGRVMDWVRNRTEPLLVEKIQ